MSTQVIPKERVRLRPVRQWHLLGGDPNSWTMDTFSRTDWLAYSMNIPDQDLKERIHPFGKFLPPPPLTLDTQQLLDNAMKRVLVQSNEPALIVMPISPDRLHTLLHQRIFYQTRAAQYFERHATKSFMSQTHPGLHRAHFHEALHFCFNLAWWSNRADINHLGELIWGQLHTLTKQLFVLRMSALASFEALVAAYDGTHMELARGKFDTKILQLLLQVQLWGERPTRFCEDSVANTLYEFQYLSRTTWMYMYIQHENLLNGSASHDKFVQAMEQTVQLRNAVLAPLVKTWIRDGLRTCVLARVEELSSTSHDQGESSSENKPSVQLETSGRSEGDDTTSFRRNADDPDSPASSTKDALDPMNGADFIAIQFIERFVANIIDGAVLRVTKQSTTAVSS